MEITSLVGKFSGIVTYNDNTSGTFHTQIEGDNVWSEDQAEAVENLKQISWYSPNVFGWPYWGAILISITKLPFLSFTWDTPLPTSQKRITDMVAKLDLIMTRDDGQTYCVAVIITGTVDNIRIEIPDLASGATNLSDVKHSIQDMFRHVMAEADVA